MQIDFSQELLHGNRVELWSLDFEACHIVCFLVDRDIFNLGLARNLVRHLELLVQWYQQGMDLMMILHGRIKWLMKGAQG